MKKFYIATPDRTILGGLHSLSNSKKYTFNGIEYSTITFDIYDTEQNPHFTDIKINNKIYIEDTGWFILEEPEEIYNEDGAHFKSCTIYSAEHELKNQQLDNFIINMGTDGSLDGIALYNPEEPASSLLHITLEKYFPEWNIRNVDASLTGPYVQECFEINDKDIYSFLMEDVSKKFGCVFLFDIMDYAVDVVKADNLGNDTTVYLTRNNLIKKLSKKLASTENVVTCIHVFGGDIDIHDVNIGTNKLYNFSYYYDTIQKINPELYEKLMAWDGLIEDKREEYISNSICYNLLDSEINEYQYTMYPESAADTSWAKYSLYYLESMLDNKKVSKEQFKEENPDIADNPDHPSYELYMSMTKDVDDITAEIGVKNAKIAALKEQQSVYHDSMNAAYTTLNYDYYFTSDEKKFLSNYLYEKSYTDSNFVRLSTDTDGCIDEEGSVYDGTIITKERNLLHQSLSKLESLCLPQYEISSDIINLFKIEEFKPLHGQFNLCDFMTVYFTPDTYTRLRLIQISGDFNDGSNFDITFSNMTRHKDYADDLDYLLDTSLSGSGSASSANNYGSSRAGTGTSQSLSAAEVQRMINNALLSSGANFTSVQLQQIYNLINGTFSSLTGKYIRADQLDALVADILAINADTITSNYIKSKYLLADELDANLINSNAISSNLAQLNEAQIEVLFSENAFTRQLISIASTSAASVINEAYIKEIIARSVTAADLKAGDITVSDQIRIVSENGNMVADGSTLQFLNPDGEIGIQIGYADNEYPSIIVKDDNGATIMTSEGITENAVADGMIKNEMLGDKSVNKRNLDWTDISEGVDENGNPVWDISKVYLNGESFGAQYISYTESTTNSISKLENDIGMLSDLAQTIEISGSQVFVDDNGTMTPSALTLTATAKNNAVVSSWLIDGRENTSYVSEDKRTITIPSECMANKSTAVIKAQNADGSVFDVFTIYRVSNGKNGADSIVSVINSSNGQIIKENGSVTSTILSLTVYKGDTIVTPNSYEWFGVPDEALTDEELSTGIIADSKWIVLATTPTVTIDLNTFTTRNQVKCKFDI